MSKVKAISVYYNNILVGTLALYMGRLAAFEYDNKWIQNGFAISPFSLPLEKKVYIPKIDPFEGLFGVFADSLPDGWGKLLVDRQLLKRKLNPSEISSIERLAIVGASGMGALYYEPEFELGKSIISIHDYDKIATECEKILKTNFSDNLDDLFMLGGSSGGARPKILTTINGEEWIIKFPSTYDSKNIGEEEYIYSLCAKECGIIMEETKLFPSAICSGYFGTKRFDRKINSKGELQKIHMLSVSAILETSHRIPNLDYNNLMRLTLELTSDFSEVDKLYRLMCFNVFAHNRDDHSKNFTFIYDETKHSWALSPAYDLTFSSSIGGEHATCINGNGKNPDINDILEVANKIGIKNSKAKDIANEIKSIVVKHKHKLRQNR